MGFEETLREAGIVQITSTRHACCGDTVTEAAHVVGIGRPTLSFQTPVPVDEILRGIHHKDYLLPAIQREFVWDADQIRRLVDSLLRGYPIGSFLVWRVEPETAGAYAFYDFLTDYHERDNPYAARAVVPGGQGALAILDGQQRLTALNIAVYGSLAVKKKYAWWNSTDAFPRRRLYLNLLADADPGELVRQPPIGL